MEHKPIRLYLLVLLLAFQSLGGLFGGISLVAFPSGAIMQMPLSMLEGSPFSDFLSPGLILLLILGIFPGILTYAEDLPGGGLGFSIFTMAQVLS